MKRTRVRLAIAAAVEDWAAGVGYEYGAKTNPDVDPHPDMVMDCSGAITRWVYRAGIFMLERDHGRDTIKVIHWHGSYNQRDWCKPLQVDDPVAFALGPKGIGCLLFRSPSPGHPGHVALSMGHGATIECRSRVGVDIVPAAINLDRRWTEARKLPPLFEEIR
jgi:hypothetical protein